MEEQASGRQARRRSEAEASELRQLVVLLEQQQIKCVDASEKLKFGCQVYGSCGMQHAPDE
eukprot:12899065-Prorocentrum_lima.AAC.1